MLMVKIEMWPHGDSSRKRDLAAIAIGNVGGDAETGDYEYLVSHQIDSAYARDWCGHEAFAAHGQGAWKRGKVTGFKRSLGAVRLLQTVLRGMR
jgi:hypothetical protein